MPKGMGIQFPDWNIGKMKYWKIVQFAAMISLVLCLSHCHKEMVEDPVYDFILNLPDAKREFQQVIVDLSDPTHHVLMGDGWNLPAEGATPLTKFLWTASEVAYVEFPVETPEEFELLICVRPIIFEGSPEITLDLQFNTHYLGEITLAPDWRVYRLVIPADTIVAGPNILLINQDQVFQPINIWEGSTDRRRLGSTFSYFVLRSLRDPIPPGMYTLSQVIGESDFYFKGTQKHVIHDRPGSQFTFTLDLPSRPVLSFGAGILPDSITLEGPPAILEVSVRESGQKDMELLWRRTLQPPRRVLEMGWDTVRRDLSRYGSKKVEIIFRTDSEAGEYTEPGNDGSWQEPVILNRHIPCNVILIPGTGPDWPPKSPETDTAASYLQSISTEVLNFDGFPTGSAGEDTIPLDMDLIRLLKHEGLQTGYFYTGRNQAIIEDRYSGDFDAVIGSNSTSRPEAAFVEKELIEWFRRLGGSNFILVLENARAEFEPGLQITLFQHFLQQILPYGFEHNSIFVVFNRETGHPVLVHIPEKFQVESLEISNWDDLIQVIRLIYELNVLEKVKIPEPFDK